MITNAAAKYLWDVQRAAERIARFTAGRTLDDYLADEMLSAAVERQFEIIGEALVGLRRIAPEAAAMVPDLPQIVAFRNVLIHAYGDVDSKEVWGTIQDDLPGLRDAVADLLRSGPSP
ncbi:MAG TPA: HepT-like ribonuclease domain-containing protein [Stellaceae bacterium]|nr:HepT-like ribonuclease domain-containing protein [Stellaceae bacterium]HKN10630.1 HepT-like ribonuclease domain-containing protein [Pseudomonadota bacterium]HMD64224.1 HepT-like ribonuclease domain-containing protein [Stellaceae bacterium]